MVKVETFRNVIDIDNNSVDTDLTDFPEYVHMDVDENNKC